MGGESYERGETKKTEKKKHKTQKMEDKLDARKSGGGKQPGEIEKV